MAPCAKRPVKHWFKPPKDLKEHPLKIVLAAGLSIVSRLASFYQLPWLQKKTAFGNCELKPLTPPKVGRLNEYIQQGQAYARHAKYKEAADEFQIVIDTDAHYLGAQQNLGVVQLREGKIEEAIHSFRKELNLIDCLKSVDKNERWRFAYVVDESKTKHSDRASAFNKRLDEAEDTVNYNLACALTQGKEPQLALDQLGKAARKGSSIRQSDVAADPDLEPLHKYSRYQTFLKQFRQQ